MKIIYICLNIYSFSKLRLNFRKKVYFIKMQINKYLMINNTHFCKIMKILNI